MSRVSLASAFVCAFVSISSLQAAQDKVEQACTPDAAEQAVAADSEQAALLAREARIVETPTGVSAPMGSPEILMVRVMADGTRVVVCVEGEAAARRFLKKSETEIGRGKNQ